MYLQTFSQGFVYLECHVFGIQFEPIMYNPLFQSTSFTEFWGRRWNTLIHHALQRGVYKPVRKQGYPKYIAMICSFLASALFHELIVCTVFSSATTTSTTTATTAFSLPSSIWKLLLSSSSSSSSLPSLEGTMYGGPMVFFLWQAVLISGQYTIGHWKIFQSIPFPLNTILILALGGCMGHYFTEPYVRSNFFIQGSFLFPLFVPLSSSST